MNRTDILRIYEIDAELLDLDNATSAEGNKVAYRYKIEQEIYKFREKNKIEVLGKCQILGDDHFYVHSVKNINVKVMDGNLLNYTFQNSKSQFDKLCGKKFFEKVYKFIKTGKGKITEAQVLKNFKKRLDKFRELNLIGNH